MSQSVAQNWNPQGPLLLSFCICNYSELKAVLDTTASSFVAMFSSVWSAEFFYYTEELLSDILYHLLHLSVTLFQRDRKPLYCVMMFFFFASNHNLAYFCMHVHVFTTLITKCDRMSYIALQIHMKLSYETINSLTANRTYWNTCKCCLMGILFLTSFHFLFILCMHGRLVRADIPGRAEFCWRSD